MRKPITCPLTGHIETLDLERTSLGIVIERCSRFTPSDHVHCSGECARRLDVHDRAGQDDLTERILVLYAVAARGRQPAEALASALREENMTVEVADVETGGAPPPQDYDGLVIVAPRGVWGDAPRLSDYLDEHDAALRAMPSWYFPISRSGDASAQQLTARAHELARMISDDMPAWDRLP